MVSGIEALCINEAVELPKFKAGLGRLLNKKAYDYILVTHSLTQQGLSSFIEKAIEEGNAVLIQREYCGYMVVLWKD